RLHSWPQWALYCVTPSTAESAGAWQVSSAAWACSTSRAGVSSWRWPPAGPSGLGRASAPDHIAAIDNTTRKLLQDGHKPVGVGFFFSLGHSTVVFLIAVALGLTVKWLVDGVVNDSGQL